jgi:hypothetical protein
MQIRRATLRLYDDSEWVMFVETEYSPRQLAELAPTPVGVGLIRWVKKQYWAVGTAVERPLQLSFHGKATPKFRPDGAPSDRDFCFAPDVALGDAYGPTSLSEYVTRFLRKISGSGEDYAVEIMALLGRDAVKVFAHFRRPNFLLPLALNEPATNLADGRRFFRSVVALIFFDRRNLIPDDFPSTNVIAVV